MKIFIDGGHGATGIRLKKYLTLEGYEVLVSEYSKRHNLEDRLKLASEAEVTVLCTPNEISNEFNVELNSQQYNGHIIDTSSNNRLKEDWFYAHPLEENLFNEKTRISNPGCFSSAMISLIKPIKNIIKDYSNLHFTGITGYSAGGIHMIERVKEQPIYSKKTNLLKVHTHEEEVNTYFNDSYNVIFSPYVGNFENGQSITLTLTKENLKYDIQESLVAIEKEYSKNKLFNLMLGKSSYDIKEHPQTFSYDVYLSNPVDSRIQISFVYDNLNIGSAGNVVRIINDLRCK